MVKKMIHLEGAIVFLAMIYIYSFYEVKWWIFILFLFTPYVSMIGYIADNRIGSIIYHLCHTYTFSVLSIFVGFFFEFLLFFLFCLFWICHIVMVCFCWF